MDKHDEDEFSHNIDRFFKYMTDDPIGLIHEHNIDIRANHIYLLGEERYVTNEGGKRRSMSRGLKRSGEEPGVEFAMANRFIRNLNILMRKSDKPILVHMKTCGGMWEEGMAIYDAIKACPNKITILSYTHAESMSSLIFLAADKKVMMPHSKFMFHEGTMDQSGTVKQYRTEGEELEKAGEDMLRIYIDAMKEKGKMKRWSRDRIKEWLVEMMNKKEEVYFDAKQAVDHGFADEIFGGNGKYDWKELINFDDE